MNIFRKQQKRFFKLWSSSKRGVDGGVITHYFVEYSGKTIYDTSFGDKFRGTPKSEWIKKGSRTGLRLHKTIYKDNPEYRNIIRRIKFELNRNATYSPVFNNCEQVANFVMSGKRESLQVRRVVFFGSMIYLIKNLE